MNKIVTNELVKSSLISMDYSVFNYLNVITFDETLAELFMDSCFPSRVNVGADYAITPIGALLNLSILPKVPGGKFDHFTDPMDQVGIELYLYLLIKYIKHIYFEYLFVKFILGCKFASRRNIVV